MPGAVKTKADEKLWSRAKDKAEEAGQKENWAYVMSIFQKMKNGSFNRFQKIAYRTLARGW